MLKESHKKLFWKFCQKYLDVSDKQMTSKTITAEKVQKIKGCPLLTCQTKG